MERVQSTKLWGRTLGKPGGTPAEVRFRQRLALSFDRFRSRVEILAGEIPNDLRSLTVHDISHIDSLWEIADILLDDQYPIGGTEAFILGGAFLLHDLGLALASYPDGLSELQRDVAWNDAVARALKLELGRHPRPDEIANPGTVIASRATESVLRMRHAKRAECLALIAFQHTPTDPQYYLIEDVDLRTAYGHLMGRIAYSHWWSMDELVRDPQLSRKIGSFPDDPESSEIHPLKLAIILRTADACHLDARRAPGFLRALRKPGGTAELHWRLQEYLQQPHSSKGRIVFSATSPVPERDREAWWTGYDLLQVADRELRDAEVALAENALPPLIVHGVGGIANPASLARHIPTDGWIPIDTSVRSTDIISLVKSIGGKELYGSNPTVPLRELIQNARDAVAARRAKAGLASDWGQITVRLNRDGEKDYLEVDDNGLGMSDQLLTGALLDFGNSYWTSNLCAQENPGLLARGFEPQGQYGIGFFSVFMLGDRVTVTTRRPEDAANNTRILQFEHGLDVRPVLRNATESERRENPGTCVRIELRKQITHQHGLLAPRDLLGQSGVRDNSLEQPAPDRRTPFKLADLCAWLCPALDVDLCVVESGNSEMAVRSSDWKTMDGKSLFCRLLLHREDRDELLDSGVFDQIICNLREVYDAAGLLVGRATLTYWLDDYPTPDGNRIRPPGVVTAGCFRARTDAIYPGLLIGRPSVASRGDASPIAFDYPEQLAQWATLQAALVHTVASGLDRLSQLAGTIRLLNGDTANLPIGEYEGRILSFRDIASLSSLPNEIELMEAGWGHRPADITRNDPRPNVIAVSMGRMKVLYHGPDSQDDFQRRADHPRWRQYWMSLWGATIEAIALAWGVPLQKLIESSEILAEGHSDSIVDGKVVSRILRDIIRKPSA